LKLSRNLIKIGNYFNYNVLILYFKVINFFFNKKKKKKKIEDLYKEAELYKNLLSIVNDNIYKNNELTISVLSLFIELLQVYIYYYLIIIKKK